MKRRDMMTRTTAALLFPAFDSPEFLQQCELAGQARAEECDLITSAIREACLPHWVGFDRCEKVATRHWLTRWILYYQVDGMRCCSVRRMEIILPVGTPFRSDLLTRIDVLRNIVPAVQKRSASWMKERQTMNLRCAVVLHMEAPLFDCDPSRRLKLNSPTRLDETATLT